MKYQAKSKITMRYKLIELILRRDESKTTQMIKKLVSLKKVTKLVVLSVGDRNHRRVCILTLSNCRDGRCWLFENYQNVMNDGIWNCF